MDNAVEIRGLCKRRGDFSMEGLDLEIPTGYVVGLIGENGAGKTTLIKCITGANILDSGEIRLFGSPFAEADRSRIGVVFDECKFMQKCFLERLKASFYMNDVATLSSVKIERGTSYPFARTFSFSLQATF